MAGPVICVSGHRFVTMPGRDQAESLNGRLERVLRPMVRKRLELIAPSTLIAGGAIGYDLVVTEVAHEMGIPYVLALPFMGYDSRWEQRLRDRMIVLITNASRVHYVSGPGYAEYKMRRRNNWMIDNSKCMMALWSGRAGGTANAIMYAYSRRKDVVNIWREFVALADDRSL